MRTRLRQTAFILIGCMAVFATVLTSCKKKSSNGDNSKIVGRWMMLEEELDFFDIGDTGMYWIFNSDNSGSQEMSDDSDDFSGTFPFTYSYNDAKKTLTIVLDSDKGGYSLRDGGFTTTYDVEWIDNDTFALHYYDEEVDETYSLFFLKQK